MSDVRSGMVIAGKYRLEAVLARGGMGSVWRARHVMLETPVAIKFIGADVFALQEARRRFEREAKAAALLQSPHVVRIHDYGVEGDIPYLVMELLSGEDLGTYLKRRGKLTPEETANIVFQVARALRRAAEAGIVHRDLKPSNVFILRDDDDEDLIKVLDFGIAKAPRGLRADDDSTRKGAIIGSPRYMSPEQARGSPLVDPRSDLWSLAVIVYRAVTGELPFQSLDMTDIIVKICTEDPVPPSQIDITLGPEMDEFFARALDRTPDRRFQTAREFAAAFASAAGLPPPSVSSRRLMVRHPSCQMEVPASVRSPVLPPALPEAAAEGPPAEPPAAVAPAKATPAAAEPGSLPAADPSSPRCDPTRISGPPPPLPAPHPVEAPALAARVSPPPVAVRVTPVPKGTPPTPYPSGVDLPAARTGRPPRPVLLRRLALGAAISALIVACLFWLTPWRRPAPPAVAVDAPPIVSTPSPSADHAPPTAAASPPLPRPSPAPEIAMSASSPVAPPSAAPVPPAPKPAPAAGPKRKHPILGI